MFISTITQKGYTFVHFYDYTKRLYVCSFLRLHKKVIRLLISTITQKGYTFVHFYDYTKRLYVCSFLRLHIKGYTFVHFYDYTNIINSINTLYYYYYTKYIAKVIQHKYKDTWNINAYEKYIVEIDMVKRNRLRVQMVIFIILITTGDETTSDLETADKHVLLNFYVYVRVVL